MSYFANNEITIEVTNRCAAKCIMCPREKMTQNLDVMSLDVYKKIIDNSNELGIEIIDLCGYGDVFLDRTLEEKLAYTKKVNKNFKIYISTTGNALRENIHDWVFKYTDILKFSIYGFSEDVYKKVMGGLKYSKSLTNIIKFLEINKKFNNKIYTIGNYIRMDENKHEEKDWKKFWEPKLDEIYVWLPHNYVDGRKYRTIDKTQQKTCGRPLEGPLNIAVDGKAHVCCFDYNKKLVIGDIKNSTIEEVLSSTEMKKIQEQHRKNDFKGLICDGCDQTNHDEKVLLYKSNPKRVVGQSNSSLHVFNKK